MSNLVKFISDTVIFLFEERGQTPIGTAFIIGYPTSKEPDMIVPLVVTAKHVIGNRERIIGRFTPAQGSLPFSVPYDLVSLRRSGDVWEHQDEGVDLMVFRTPHFEQVDYTPFPTSLIASRQTFSDEDIMITDRIMFPCLLVNFMGTSRNYPVVRGGTIALIPEEPVQLEYFVGSRRIRTSQHVIMIDATAVLGASGSPIFLYPGPRPKRGAFTIGGGSPLLLGIMHGFYPTLPRNLVTVQSRARVGFSENSGIAIVFPSWLLLEIIERNDVKNRINDLLTSLPAHNYTGV